MSFGLTEQEAFYNLQRRVTSEDLNLLINAILIQKDIGGNLAEILDNITETIRERQKIKNELKTLTAQGKLT
ncbi:Type II secretion system (T2SS), protein F [Caloramator proteoclasticus DSM 10124]|uniref:Type II secretion system (T2SS), protein F n=2 Tax=Caloramator TaxID=44258 RepID=A0A1M5C9N4_9CLOT|nr:Type II secretion system (T2SS), protein F [Caloramator proteoclasticus DSM 10124]